MPLYQWQNEPPVPKKILQRTNLQKKIKLWFDSGNPLKRIFKPPKERLKCPPDCQTCLLTGRPNTCNMKSLIYQVECKICQSIYIGETKRTIGQRIKEHTEGPLPSAVKSHFKEFHPTAKIDITWNILHTGLRQDQKRQLIEASYIKNMPRDKLMNSNQSLIHNSSA